MWVRFRTHNRLNVFNLYVVSALEVKLIDLLVDLVYLEQVEIFLGNHDSYLGPCRRTI